MVEIWAREVECTWHVEEQEADVARVQGRRRRRKKERGSEVQRQLSLYKSGFYSKYNKKPL